MTQKSTPTGMIMPYGVAIGDALSRDASTDELIALRHQANAIVNAQGDLIAALKALDEAIAARGGREAAVASERFVVQIDGVGLAADVKKAIDHAIQKAVTTEIAKIDGGADLVSTPLSAIRNFGFGPGAHTPGLYLVNKNIAVR